MPLSTSVIINEVCHSGDMQVFLFGGRSLTILENLSGRSLIILENLWRSLYLILKTSLSPKDQGELFIPFSKYEYDLGSPYYSSTVLIHSWWSRPMIEGVNMSSGSFESTEKLQYSLGVLGH